MKGQPTRLCLACSLSEANRLLYGRKPRRGQTPSTGRLESRPMSPIYESNFSERGPPKERISGARNSRREAMWARNPDLLVSLRAKKEVTDVQDDT